MHIFTSTNKHIMKKQDLTAPKITARLVGLPMADGCKFVETVFRDYVKVTISEYMVHYHISDRYCKIRVLRVVSDRITGRIFTVKATY